MVSLQRIENRFNVLTEFPLEHIGVMIQFESMWTFYPKQRRDEINEEIVAEIDRILRVLNNTGYFG